MSSVLVMSFSDIANDARVRKQVSLLAQDHQVTTLGFGERPVGSIRHLRIDPQARHRLTPQIHAVRQRLRRYHSLYWKDPLVRAAGRALDALDDGFDAVVANDIDTIPLAVQRWPDRVHADLHEFFPGEHDDLPDWVRLRQPYYEWLIRTYATRAPSITTVSRGLADEYATYGLACDVVPNAAPYHPLAPSTTSWPLRLVHSGVAQPGRRLELTMRAVARSEASHHLDLYLMPSDVAYLEELRTLAANLGPTIRICDPLTQGELIPTLNGYDVGVFVLPPTTTNNRLALPNKLFDFVQARLGVIIGPSPAMAEVVTTHAIGRVARGFDEDALLEALNALDTTTVDRWKAASDAAADELSGERQSDTWRRAVAAIVG